MTKSFGFSLLADQVAEHLASEWEWMAEERGAISGRSPIERLLFEAVSIRCQIGASEVGELRIARNSDDLLRLQEEHTFEIRLIVWPQAPLADRRVDFLFFAKDFRLRGDEIAWRRLIVECDGHDFHERTKEQAAKDRAKDRAATMANYDSFRFTGSEIWRDPWGCATQITEWVAKGFY